MNYQDLLRYATYNGNGALRSRSHTKAAACAAGATYNGNGALRSRSHTLQIEALRKS